MSKRYLRKEKPRRRKREKDIFRNERRKEKKYKIGNKTKHRKEIE